MADEAVCISLQQTKPIKILKWKVRQGNTVPPGRIILIYEFAGEEKPEPRKLKSTQDGTIHKIIAQEGDVVKPGEALYESKTCSHPTIMIDMCAECGADLRNDETQSIASVPMVHAIPDLKVSEEQAQKLGRADSERLIKDRKLVLLVDLDQTLIHTTNDNIPPNIKDVYHFQLYGSNSPWYHTRLRPGTHRFLNNIFNFFELHICTFGARNYAHTIAMFLDVDQKFFSNRILSRDECFDPTSKKANLKALFPCGDDMVCIIDDREDVWNHALNLIHVKPYHFFQHTGDINAPPGLDKHENDDKAGVDLTKIVAESEEKKEKNGSVDTKVEKGATDNTEQEECKESKEMVNGNQIKSNKKEDKNGKKENGSTEADNEIDETKEKDDRIEKETESSRLPDMKSEEKDLKKEMKESNTEQDQGDTNKSDTKRLEETREKLPDQAGNLNENNGKLKNIENIAVIKDPKVKNNKENNLIEIDDPDDYLFYLEDILKRIHKAFYEEYDKMESGVVPDLKKVIPLVKNQILKGTKLVFSGLVPTHIKLEQSRAYQVARSLGAIVTQDIEDDTTHLVAVRPGTAKVNVGRRKKNLKIVTPDWLWSCAERWEHADERIFTLSSKGSKNRHPPPHCSSPEHIANYPEHDMPALRKRTPSGRFMDTINPLMSFSSDDIANMDKEVEDILDDESDDSTDEEAFKKKVEEQLLNSKEVEQEESSSSSDDSLSGDTPKGHKRKRSKDEEEDEDNRLDDPNNSTEEDELPSTKFRRGESVDSELDMDDDAQESDGSLDPPDEMDDGEWNMMGAALEREFLSD